MKYSFIYLLLFFFVSAFSQELPTIGGESAETGFQKYYNKKSPYSVEGIPETQIQVLPVKFAVDEKGGIKDAKVQLDPVKPYLLPVIEDLKEQLRYAPWKPARIKGKNRAQTIQIEVRINAQKAMAEYEKFIASHDGNPIFVFCETMPLFDNQPAQKSFTEYLLKNTTLPPSTLLIAEFIALEDGSLSDYRILRSNKEQANELVLEAIKNAPNLWTSGFQRGRPVKVRMFIEIKN